MVFTTQCPRCEKILWFSEKIAGTVTICPACGGLMQLPTIPVPVGSPPPPPPAPPPPPPPLAAAPQGAQRQPTDVYDAAPAVTAHEAVPPDPQFAESLHDSQHMVAALSMLVGQAAAEVGEAPVDIPETDLVQWTMQPHPQVPMQPAPAWSPQPIAAPPPPPLTFQTGPSIPAPPLPPPPKKKLIARIRSQWTRQKTIVALSAIGVAVLVLGGVLLLTLVPFSTPWDQVHQQEILDLKQRAEDLAMNGRYRDAYEKYQELESFVAGHPITSDYLKGELDKSWRKRDELFEHELNGPARANVAPAPSPPAATPTPASTEPTTEDSIGSAAETEKSGSSIARAPPPAAPGVSTAVATPARPTILSIHPEPPPENTLTDAQIGQSIDRASTYLLSQFVDSHLPSSFEHADGLDALAVYALMQSYLATHDKRLDIHEPFMSSAVDQLKAFPMSQSYITYARALRATALSLYARPEDRSSITRDVVWLINAQRGGGFTYENDAPRHGNYDFSDNSNSQYGLLGVWSAAEAGTEVPLKFWSDVEQHWIRDELPDGQWTYRHGDQSPRLSMTLAGIASLFVTQDYLEDADSSEHVGRPPFSPALARGLAWLESGDNSVVNPQEEFDFYTLYGLERVGLASGFKDFGTHDWYRQLAANLIAQQNADGSFGGRNGAFESIVDTSYALLFLARGRHPVLMNKLRFDGHWGNRPRDAANLARFASIDLERPLNWQVVPLDHDWQDWTDSRIVYLASESPVPLTADDVVKLRSYVQSGGMLLMQADGSSQTFTDFATKLGTQLFPQYSWVDLTADDPLYSVSYRIDSPPPTRVISNGSRILVMLWPQDVSHLWQRRQDRANTSSLDLGVNVALYAAGKGDLHNRLENPEIPAAKEAADVAIPVARLRYDGNWDPEPAAWPRAGRWFRQQTGNDIALSTVDVQNLSATQTPIAHLTGTAKWTAGNAQVTAVHNFVDAGGVLVIDPCGKPGDFYSSVTEDLLPRAFPGAHLRPLDADHPLFHLGEPGMVDLSDLAVRPFVRTIPDITSSQPLMLRFGKGHVIVLPVDWTSGLLGVDAWGIAGYTPEASLKLLDNLLIWAWDGAADGNG